MRIGAEKVPDLAISSLTALSPLDGRYEQKVKDLRPFFSEYGLIRYRVIVEVLLSCFILILALSVLDSPIFYLLQVMWLLKLSEMPEIAEVPSFSADARSYLDQVVHKFDLDDAMDVKNIEKVTNHDVKAVEYFLKKKCQHHPEISKVFNF